MRGALVLIPAMSDAATADSSGRLRWRFNVHPLTLALLTSVYFAVFCNTPFWQRILGEQAAMSWRMLPTAIATFALIVSLHFILFAPLMNRWTAKPVVVVLVVLTAMATYFMDRYGIYIDTDMVRNLLGTDMRESSDLLAPDMLTHLLLYAGLPLLLLSRVDLRQGDIRQSWWILPASIVTAIGTAAFALMVAGSQLVPQLREHHEIRYLVTPGNYLVSIIQVASARKRISGQPLQPVALDARKATTTLSPLVLVVVVGETVRAQNWGLNGYSRQTTPQLSLRDVVNFSDVEACGTNTEVSLPCMFSVNGRRHYDAERIRSSESLLHIVDRVGVKVMWRDNQSGCKGVCDGLAQMNMRDSPLSKGCDKNGCFDEQLLSGLREEIVGTTSDAMIVLHQMGNHGPAYHLRYPKEFKHFMPECDTNELWKCSDDKIVNAYDNAILYTDDLIAKTIDLLSSLPSGRRVALIYVSDHGESLGEQGLYLHSLPRAIAPDTQTKVPMVAWFSPEFLAQSGITQSCLHKKAGEKNTHDNLFHTVLGMFGVSTSVYETGLDILFECRV